MDFSNLISRRRWLRAGAGLLGLSLPQALALRAGAATGTAGFGKAKSVIVLYCWGGMSPHETLDPKPDAPLEVRGTYQSIATATPGVRVGEYIPKLAKQTKRLAIVRSVHHRSSAHGKGMYWNITGHPPPEPTTAANLPPTRSDWPCLGAMVGCFARPARGFPVAVQIPYPLVDNKTLQAGDNAGWLGQARDPVLVRPPAGRPYGGVSRDLGAPVLQLADGIDQDRFGARRGLAERLERAPKGESFDRFRTMASDLLCSPKVRSAFDVTREDVRLRDRYGDHVCGQSVLLARRLTEAGVPFVQVVCAAGDLNGSAGDHWDTHGNNFVRLKRDLLPPLERALCALLDDLDDRGRLAETLVVVLTEFGRTPKINGGAGRDHYPNVYSVAFAGGGVRGGQVHGSSDRIGAFPREKPCGPADLHATIFHALGIRGDATLTDNLGRPIPLTEGTPLPLV
jgi:uncharacterized protein (DUF1501 family)